MAPLRGEVEFKSCSPQSFDTIFKVTGNFSSLENKRVCDIMASPSQNFLDMNSAVIPALRDYDGEFSHQMLQRPESSFQKPLGADMEKQQSERTSKYSKSTKRAKLSKISLEDYMRVFNRLTDGKGNVVQPNRDLKLFTKAELTSVLRLHGLKTSLGVKNNLFLSLVGVELWNPFMPLGPLPGPLEPRNITDEEMMEDLHVLQW